MSFDISIAFDTAAYINTQLYMLVDTLKDKLPEDTILHLVTNRSKDDKVVKHICKNIPTKIYFNNGDKTGDLKSRCRYMFNCFDVDTDKDWLIKIEADFIVLKHLSVLDKILDNRYDLVIEPENRKIFDDKTAERLWRIIYNKLGIETPTKKIQYRENGEWGLPLYGTGMVGINSKHLPVIQERWVPLTKLCEKWINYNIHPNEFAFTAMSFDEEWKTYLYEDIYKYNPIGHWRSGSFPSVKLIDKPIIPDDVVILDYHRPQWLMHIANNNKVIGDVLCRNSKCIPEDWWNLTNKEFLEG